LVAVCRADELALNASRVVQAGERAIAVFNMSGQFFAIDDRCPHKGASLGKGSLVEGVVTCPAHNFKIDIRTGRNPKTPVLKVACYRVIVEDGIVKVLVPLDRFGAGRG
jgi:nitrite reductase (NADH) small subunit/3-phenylpropionate/trans-cinnamate dioxygenase ferredoxin subunit